MAIIDWMMVAGAQRVGAGVDQGEYALALVIVQHVPQTAGWRQTPPAPVIITFHGRPARTAQNPEAMISVAVPGRIAV